MYVKLSFLALMILFTLNSCMEGAFQPTYIISDSSEEEEGLSSHPEELDPR